MGESSDPTNRSDPRWGVVIETGDWSLLGRYTEPTPDELLTITARLESLNVGGWLVIFGNSIYEETPPEVIVVRLLGNPVRSFPEALQLLREKTAPK